VQKAEGALAPEPPHATRNQPESVRTFDENTLFSRFFRVEPALALAQCGLREISVFWCVAGAKQAISAFLQKPEL